MTDADRTPGQIEADNELSAAIAKSCAAYGHLDDGWAIGDYVLCVEYTAYGEGLQGRERYGYILPFDFMPTHRIKGLLHQTLEGVKSADE